MWDVSSVRDMNSMFLEASVFSCDLSKWDVSRASDMSGMSKWDVSRATDMSGMFWNALAFNSDISKWDVSSVTTMYRMFFGAVILNTEISKSP